MRNMTEGRPSSLILSFSLPLLAGNVLQQAYNLVDSLVVGNFVGKEALAAVGGTFIVNFLLVSLFAGLGMGFSIVISQFFGAGKRDRVKAAVDTGYASSLVGAVPVTLAGILLAGPLLRALNVPAGLTMEMSNTYLTILFIGTIGSFGYNLNAGILQGLGDSMSSLAFLAVATVLNIALDLLFVAVFGWGVAGVAWATVVSQTVSFFLGTAHIVRKLKLTSLRAREFRFDPPILRECARIGLPGGFQNMLFSLGTMAIQRLINGYGPSFMAAFSISGRLDSLAFMPIASFASAVTTFVGQNTGAGRLDRVLRGHRATQLMSLAVCVAVSVSVILSARTLMGLFTDDREVIENGAQVLFRLMPAYFMLSIFFNLNAAIRGTGESVFPFFASLSSFLLTRMPAAYLLDHFFGKNEIGWCFGLGWIVGLSVALPYWFAGKWKKRIPSKNLQIAST